MTAAKYLGMELSEAVRALEAEGHTVTLVETRSKKGVSMGTERRVVRVRTAEAGESTVELAWALFKTDVYFAAP